MRAVIVGATGLIGSGVVQEILADARWQGVTSVGRRSQSPQDRKWVEKIGSMTAVESLCQGIAADVAFCCLGTTIGKAGSQEAFAEIDQHLPIRFAKAILKNGVKHFHVVSSIGADPESRNFYLRTKGLMEEGLKSVGFDSLVIYRPSLLVGEREEKRFFERVSIMAFRAIKPVYPRFLETWEPIEARDVARLMVREAEAKRPGTRVLENRAMHGLIRE